MLELEISSAPETVKPPATLRLPITSEPAVTALMSAVVTVNVPAPPATVIDLEPFGMSETVPFPALTVPEKATSLAVIVIAEFVLDIEVETAFVTLPVPSVVIVTPVEPVTSAFIVTAPLEPEDVCRVKALPKSTCELVIEPLPVRLSVPLLEVRAPDVPIVADAPVVVTEKLPPTDDVPISTAPVLLISAVPVPPVFAVMVEAAVNIGVPALPMLPVPDVN